MPRQTSKRTLFFCQSCGQESPRWMGFCPACNDRTPLVEAPMPDTSSSRSWTLTSASEPRELVSVASEENRRISLRYKEMDRVLGGGLVRGSLALFAGEPGVGKSTLLLQAADFVASNGLKVIYASGEESEHQIKLRSDRLGLSGQGLYLLAETDVDQVILHLERHLPDLVVVDSIQTLFTEGASSGPGSIAQVRECTLRLMRWAKTRGAPVILAGHVTKDGTLAGPRVLEHIVDVVMYLEGENLGAHRLLRSVKNRFGSTNEVAMFQMGGHGMEEVSDPSKFLLEERGQWAVGSAVVPVLEGSRPLLVEIQALTSPSVLPVPRRTANGVDHNRMIMITAVLGRRARLGLANQDIIVNVAGGLRISEPGTDLAVALAIASSFRNRPIKPGLVAIGEVGLNGELRSVSQTVRRLGEAARIGFSSCVLPTSTRGKLSATTELELVYTPTVGQAIHRSLDQRFGKREMAEKKELTDVEQLKE